VFQQLLKTFLLDNPSRLTLTLTPDTALGAALAAQEAAALAAAAQTFEATDLARLAAETSELKVRLRPWGGQLIAC